jgi:hypothetical protein
MLRWIFGPTVIEGGAIRPLVGTLLDPSRPRIDEEEGPTFKELTHSTIYNPGYTRALSLVGGVDLSAIDMVADLVDLFDGEHILETEHFSFLHLKPEEMGWPKRRMDAIREIFSKESLVFREIDFFHQAITRVGKRLNPNFDARNVGYSRWKS